MKAMDHFPVRILEVHSQLAWDQDHARRVIRFAAQHGMTGIALHRNDIVDLVVYPARYFGASEVRAYRNIHERYQDIFRTLYRLTPHRRSKPNIQRDYLVWLTREANRHGLSLWLENKEVWYPDILPELFPEVLVDGRPCPTHPMWPQFLRVKYGELVVDVPGIAGIITSPGTRESRLSIAGNLCRCERCRATPPGEWHRQVLTAIYDSLKHAGKRLVVRDFVFDPEAHAGVVQGIGELPADIIVSLKNTPHDYYPTFPHNPRIGHVGPHPQWVEFDTMGQYFGWGIAPAIMLDDLKTRMDYARQHGVEGVLVRTDWESLDNHSCFRTPNVVNLHGAAALARSPSRDPIAIYAQWLEECSMLRPGLPAAERALCARWAEDVLGQTWSVTRRALYTNDCVFSDSSNFPVSLEHAWWLAEEKNSLQDWDPSKRGALRPTDENIGRILKEKEDALEIWERLNARLQDNPGLNPEAHAQLIERFRIFRLYVKGFALIGQAAILARRLIEGDGNPPTPEGTAQYGAKLRERIEALRGYEQELLRFQQEESGQEYVVYLLLNPERVRAFVDDVERQLAARTT